MAPIAAKSRRCARTVAVAALTLALTTLASTVTATPAFAWQPEPATYGVGSQTNLPITASDGTVLRADVSFGQAADWSRGRSRTLAWCSAVSLIARSA